MDDNVVLFGKDKTILKVFEDIYKSSKDKDRQLKALTAKLTAMVTDEASAANVIPLLKEYFELQIKNDDSVIKMARIAQLFLKDEKSNELSGSDDYAALMKEADAILQYQEDSNNEVTIKLDLEGKEEPKLIEEVEKPNDDTR